MEKKSNFDRESVADMMLRAFVTAYTHNQSISNVYNQFLDSINNDKKPENRKNNELRRKILEKCRDLFKNTSKKDDDKENKKLTLAEAIALSRSQTLAKTGVQPTDSEITKMLLNYFSDEIWGDDKRRYNMSALATKGMLTNISGTDKKVIFKEYTPPKDKPEERPPHITLSNKYGDSIDIEYMGCLHYKTRSSNEFLYKHRIYRNVDNDPKVYEVFSNIDINELPDNSELRYVVFTELLSKNNIENSYADGYIGETSITKGTETPLKVGEEKVTSGHYKYQITQNYALEYDGERIEAIRAYKQQEANKNNPVVDKDAEPEL